MMPLFMRKCSEMLNECLATTIIVKSIDELEQVINGDKDPSRKYTDIKIESHKNLKDCFDKRIGWYIHYVSGLWDKERIIIGSLSEPFI